MAVRSAGTGARRGGTSEVGAAWMPPAPAPGPRGGLCPGLRKGAPPALGAHQQTVMELVAGRLRPALARPSRPPGAPQALLGPSLPAYAPSCPPLLSPAQGGTLSPDPKLRGKGGLQGREGETTPACQKPWV